MARKLRIEYPGALYHVYSRGNDRDYVFRAVGRGREGQTLVFVDVGGGSDWAAEVAR